MDEFDFIDEPEKKPRSFGSAIWNLGSIFTLIASLCAGGFFTQIFLDPNSDLNPLPPVSATATLESTSTATATQADPTATTGPTATATMPPTATFTPTYEPGSYYGVQEGSPVALDSSVFHPEFACNFAGVAGQAFGLDGAPIAGLRVQIAGTWNGQPIDALGLTGAATQYGAGSYYEIRLGNQPLASDDTLTIVLLDQAGTQISNLYSFDTYASCEQNLILINFQALP